MPSKKKKYNARFPAGRIKKIMQTDDDVGKIAHGVPVVISRSVELFINSLLQQTATITRERNAKTLSQAHFKLCVLKERKFDFLKDLVKNIEDVSPEEEKKASKSNYASSVSSNAEFNVKDDHNKVDRKRIKSEFDLENDRTTKKSIISTNNACPMPTNSSEASSSNVQLNIGYSNHCDQTEVKMEIHDSCDLVNGETCDT